MIKELFVTGTDTGCGKTFVCCEILSHLASQGFDVVGLKPIASGAEMINGRLRNDDVELLYENTNIDIKVLEDHLSYLIKNDFNIVTINEILKLIKD